MTATKPPRKGRPPVPADQQARVRLLYRVRVASHDRLRWLVVFPM